MYACMYTEKSHMARQCVQYMYVCIVFACFMHILIKRTCREEREDLHTHTHTHTHTHIYIYTHTQYIYTYITYIYTQTYNICGAAITNALHIHTDVSCVCVDLLPKADAHSENARTKGGLRENSCVHVCKELHVCMYVFVRTKGRLRENSCVHVC